MEPTRRRTHIKSESNTIKIHPESPATSSKKRQQRTITKKSRSPDQILEGGINREPSNQEGQEDDCKVFVCNIPKSMTIQRLRTMMSTFGATQNTYICHHTQKIHQNRTNRTNYGFVIFRKPESAQKAVKARRLQIEGSSMKLTIKAAINKKGFSCKPKKRKKKKKGGKAARKESRACCSPDGGGEANFGSREQESAMCIPIYSSRIVNGEHQESRKRSLSNCPQTSTMENGGMIRNPEHQDQSSQDQINPNNREINHNNQNLQNRNFEHFDIFDNKSNANDQDLRPNRDGEGLQQLPLSTFNNAPGSPEEVEEVQRFPNNYILKNLISWKVLSKNLLSKIAKNHLKKFNLRLNLPVPSPASQSPKLKKQDSEN